MENEEKKPVEKTTEPEVSQAEKKPDTSKLDEDQSKNTDELVSQNEQLKETLRKAEHRIVELKKEKPDVDSIKDDVLKEINEQLEPKIKKISKMSDLEKENHELRETLKSQEGMSESTGASERKEQEPVLSDLDKKIADKYFKGDTKEYLKYKVVKP